MSNLFPAGVAIGSAFCNRDQERTVLKNNINNNSHTVIVAPRRYGKTSLVSEVIRTSGLIYCELDFLLSANARAVEARILEEIGWALQKLLPKTKSPKERILRLFHQLRPEITISALGQKVVLHSPDIVSRETTICDALLNLDRAAKAVNKRVVIFMDEFQQIGELRDGHTIEASIRHAVERSQNVSYVFSGSNRHLLNQMFNDKNRPFYCLCTTINLKRISEQDHVDFIQQHAKKKWKKQMPDDAILTIIRLSECHPYYVNLICKHFWDKNYLPMRSAIKNMWNEYIKSQKSVIAYDIVPLSNNQKILLKELAKHPTNQPFAQQCLLSTQLTIASQKEALKKLIFKDFVYKDELDFTRVLDPAMRMFIKNYC